MIFIVKEKKESSIPISFSVKPPWYNRTLRHLVKTLIVTKTEKSLKVSVPVLQEIL